MRKQNTKGLTNTKQPKTDRTTENEELHKNNKTEIKIKEKMLMWENEIN